MADIHVEFDGGLWVGDEADGSCRLLRDVPVSRFSVDPSACLGKPVSRVHISGLRINATLISLSGGCPWRIWRPAGNVAASQIQLRMSGRPAMIGFQSFELTDTDRSHYACLAGNNFLSHPLGLVFGFLGACRTSGCWRVADFQASRLAGFILDPRWWFSPRRRSRWSGLFRAVAKAPGVLAVLDECRDSADAVGLRKRYRSRGLDVLALLFWYWRCSQLDAMSPFDPRYFFENEKASAAFCEFIRKPAFDGDDLPPRIEPT